MIWSNIFNVTNWPPNKWKYPDMFTFWIWQEKDACKIYWISHLTLLNVIRYIWDRQWSTPSFGILPHRCWFVYRNAFLIIKLSNLLSFRAIRSRTLLLHNRRLKINFLLSHCYYVSHFTQVLQCFDMWYFGNRFVVGAIFIFDDKNHIKFL